MATLSDANVVRTENIDNNSHVTRIRLLIITLMLHSQDLIVDKVNVNKRCYERMKLMVTSCFFLTR